MSNKLDDGTQERLNAFCLNWNGHSVLGRRFASPFFITIEARWFGGEARQTLLTGWLQVKTLLHMMFCAVVFACTSSQLARLLKQSTAISASRYVVSLIHFLFLLAGLWQLFQTNCNMFDWFIEPVLILYTLTKSVFASFSKVHSELQCLCCTVASMLLKCH